MTGSAVCRRKSNRESARRSRQRRMQEAKECEDRIAALNQNSLQLARQMDEARHHAATATAALNRTQTARDLSANAVSSLSHCPPGSAWASSAPRHAFTGVHVSPDVSRYIRLFELPCMRERAICGA